MTYSDDSMLTFLSGGTGTPKLLQGLDKLIPQEKISVIVNTGEDRDVSGLRVCPDIDTVMYTLAGIVDDEKWYGIKGDSFKIHNTLEKLGHQEILKIGDEDRAVQLYRTMRIQEGVPLSEVTEDICKKLGVSAEVLPMTDDFVDTRVFTENGEMSFHEFWVTREGEEEVSDIKFVNSENAEPAPGVVKAFDKSEAIIIGPSNPITSVGPILSIDDIRSALERNSEKVMVISPVLGDAPVSGPTGVLMNGLGFEVSPIGVAKLYRDIAGMFLLDENDSMLESEFDELGMDVFLYDLWMPDISSRIDLAKKTLEILGMSEIIQSK